MADIGVLSTQVAQAVQVLYSNNPAAQQEANTWLTTFGYSSEAWEVCLGLLLPGPAAEVQFYAANTLLKKIREQWGSLPHEGRSHVQSAIRDRMQAIMVRPNAPQLVLSRLAILVSAAAVLSGEEASRELTRHSLSMAASRANVSVAVEILTSLAEEADELERNKREHVLMAIVSHAPEVFAMVEAVLTGRLGGRDVASPAVKCLSAWLKLDTTGAGSCLMSVKEMHTKQAGLMAALLAALGDSEGLASSSADAMVELIASDSSRGEPADGNQAATRTIMSGLLRNHGKITEENAHIGQAVGRVAGAIAEYDSSAAVGGVAEAVPLAHLMLSCLNHSDRRVVEAALDYFLMLNTVPMAERHSDLQMPLYGAMMEPLMRHATMPSDLVDWDTYAEDDEDSFNEFREQILTDALDHCYGILRLQYFAFAGRLISTANTWQKAEACLYLVRCVALSVKSRVLSDRKADLVNPEVQAEKAETNVFLVATFSAILASVESNGIFWSHIQVVEAACRLAGMYAAWFGGCSEAPLAGVLHMLLRALAIPKAGGHIRHAAHAIRNLCARCSKTLMDPSALKGLMDATEGITAGPNTLLELEDRQAVVEGLARIVSLMPLAEAQQAAIQLVLPIVRKAQSLVSNEEAGRTPEQADAMANELQLIASAVRFMEFAGDGVEGQPHPAMPVVEGVWPILASIAESSRWNWSLDVVAALCSVYQRCMLALKASAAPLVEPMAKTLVALLDATSHAPCLAALGTCAEVFGAVPDAEKLLSSALDAVLERALLRLQTLGRVELAENAELVAAALQLGDRYLVFAAGPLLRSTHLQPLLALAVRAVAMTEREPVQAALGFASHLTVPSAKQLSSAAWSAYGGNVGVAMRVHGEALVRALLVSAAGSCPRHLLRVLSGCLHGLATSHWYRQAIASVLPAVVMSPEYPAVREGFLKEEDCKRFCAAALKEPPLPRQLFDALVSDFAAICRAEGTGDALIAYEM